MAMVVATTATPADAIVLAADDVVVADGSGSSVGGTSVGGTGASGSGSSTGSALVVCSARDGAQTGSVVQGAQLRSDALTPKMFSCGGFRPSGLVVGLLPAGAMGLTTMIPRRLNFGPEGWDGDAAHSAAMAQFRLKEFGNSHVQDQTNDRRMGRVGLFGFWLAQNNYGEHVQWNVSHGECGMKRCLVAVDSNGSPRVPSTAAVMEYVLTMAVGDAASRPKGGWMSYQSGDHVKPSLHGRKRGQLMGKAKAFGTGAFADAPFRYRAIEQDVLAIRWFYDKLLEGVGGGALNPASTAAMKALMKALSYLMGQRRVSVPKALSQDVLESVAAVTDVESVSMMTALAMLVADFVWGARASDLYMMDWAELEKKMRAMECGEPAVAGVVWARLRTKNDRQGKKDAPSAPKPLQCTPIVKGPFSLRRMGD